MKWLLLAVFLLPYDSCLLVLPAMAQQPRAGSANSLATGVERDGTRGSGRDRPNSITPPQWRPPSTDSPLPLLAGGPPCPLERVLENTGSRIKELVDVLGRFTATETMLHQRLNESGKVLEKESRKSEYLIAIMQPQSGAMYVDEYRRYLGDKGGFTDGIATYGLLTLAFVFHPEMQDSYAMQCEGQGTWKEKSAWIVRFRQRPDRPRRQLGYKIGKAYHRIALKGRAWIDAANFQIVHIEAEMMEPIPEIGLLNHFEMADYSPIPFRRMNLELWLPEVTHTYVQLRSKRFHFYGQFSDFKLFEVEAKHQETVREPQI